VQRMLSELEPEFVEGDKYRPLVRCCDHSITPSRQGSDRAILIPVRADCSFKR
jgi:hypothetical protein